jgi:hypothetical protein
MRPFFMKIFKVCFVLFEEESLLQGIVQYYSTKLINP